MASRYDGPQRGDDNRRGEAYGSTTWLNFSSIDFALIITTAIFAVLAVAIGAFPWLLVSIFPKQEQELPSAVITAVYGLLLFMLKKGIEAIAYGLPEIFADLSNGLRRLTPRSGEDLFYLVLKALALGFFVGLGLLAFGAFTRH